MTDWEYIWERTLTYVVDAAVSAGIILSFFAAFLLFALLLQLITMSLRRKWYDILGERSWTLLAAPGTVIHETGHALFCLIFRHRILEIKFFSPQPDGTMGIVSHSWDTKSLYQRAGNFFIGMGPIITGIAAIITLTAFLVPEVWGELDAPKVYTLSDLGAAALSVTCRLIRAAGTPELWCKWQSWVWLLLVLLIGSHVTLSREDLKNASIGIIIIPVAVLLFNLGIFWYTNPAQQLLNSCSALLISLIAIFAFIIFVLGLINIFLHLPVFQSAPPPPQSGKKNLKK